MTEYAKRDEMELGDHYMRHDMAMTAEGLHNMADIAAELAWRDMQLEKAARVLARVSRAGVLSVLAELDRAQAKFPTWPTDPLHALAVLGEEYGELTRAVLQRCYGDEGRAELVEAEAVQVAAMALRFLASLDEYEYREGSQHRDGEQEAGSDGGI